jgi:hypothetical protein
MKMNVKPLQIARAIGFSALSAMSVFLAPAAQAATAFVNATVEGALAPGVYGRIDIGNAPPPALIYAQPVIIQRAPVYVQQPPLYLHVPPGHSKNWSKHCGRYNACGQPVYFVNVRGDNDFERRRFEEERRGRDRGHFRGREGHDDDEGHGRGHGNGNGKHKNKGHDD